MKSDGLVLSLYREWSEEHYAAGFITPTPAAVREFRTWLKHISDSEPEALEDYEIDMLEEYRRQESEEHVQ